MGNWHNQDPSTDPNEVTESTFSTPIVPGANTDFRTYKFIWKEGKITFFIYDDSGTTLIYQTEHTTNVPSAPAHFMINHWGTNNPNGFGGGATIGVDRYFHVDWVKFTPQEGAPPPPPAPLAAPSSLTAAAGSITTGKGKNRVVQGVFVDLAWQDNSTNEDSFIIERCQVVGKGKNKYCNFVQLVLAGENVTTYHDSGVTGGTTYQYRPLRATPTAIHRTRTSDRPKRDSHLSPLRSPPTSSSRRKDFLATGPHLEIEGRGGRLWIWLLHVGQCSVFYYWWVGAARLGHKLCPG